MYRKKQKERKENYKINIQRVQTLTTPLDYANHAGCRFIYYLFNLVYRPSAMMAM
jgi:hypothetical protein